jgi:hypothetical protein
MYKFEYGIYNDRGAYYYDPPRPSTREEAYEAEEKGMMRLVKDGQNAQIGWVPATIKVQESNLVFHDGFDNELRAGDIVLYSTSDDSGLLPAVIIKMLPEKVSLQALHGDWRKKIYREPIDVVLIPQEKIEL